MEKIQTTTQVEKLLRKGNTKEAIDHLLNFLESYETEVPQLYKEIIQIKAQFLRAQRRKSIGIISAKREEELMQEIHGEVHFLLDRMNGKASVRKKNIWLTVPNYVYFLAMGFALVMTLFTYSITRQTAFKKTISHCPTFNEESEFNILILPLSTQQNKSGKLLEERTKDRFQLFIDSMNLDISAQISGLAIEDEKYPQTVEGAVKLAEHCQAQLILWAEEDFVHYKFVGQDVNFTFYQLYPGQGDEFITVAHPTSVPTHGVIAKNSDVNVLNYLLGTAANQIEAYSSAAQLLRTELVDSTNTSLTLLRALQLADGEMEVNNPTQALAAYNTILDLHPEFDFARLNRSVLALNVHQFDLAIRDLNQLMASNEKNYLAHYTKGRALAKMEQIVEAEKTLRALDSILTVDSTQYTTNFRFNIIQKTLNDLAKKKFETNRDLRLSRQDLRKNPEDQALKNKVLCYLLQLGEDEKAQQLLEDYQPTNTKVLNAIQARSLVLSAKGKEELALFWKNVIPSDYAEVKLVSKKEESTQVL